MTDKTPPDLDRDSSPEERFILWLADTGDRPTSDIEVSTLRPELVAQAFGERLRQEPSVLPIMLERLATADNTERLLEEVLSQWWQAIRDGLPASPRRPTRHWSRWERPKPDSLLVYLVLSSAPNRVYHLTSDDLGFLRLACVYDPNLLRHLLTWASTQPAKRHGSVWGSVARDLHTIFAARRKHSSDGVSLRDFDWAY
jgi:hypothetical protein